MYLLRGGGSLPKAPFPLLLLFALLSWACQHLGQPDGVSCLQLPFNISTVGMPSKLAEEPVERDTQAVECARRRRPALAAIAYMNPTAMPPEGGYD